MMRDYFDSFMEQIWQYWSGINSIVSESSMKNNSKNFIVDVCSMGRPTSTVNRNHMDGNYCIVKKRGMKNQPIFACFLFCFTRLVYRHLPAASHGHCVHCRSWEFWCESSDFEAPPETIRWRIGRVIFRHCHVTFHWYFERNEGWSNCDWCCCRGHYATERHFRSRSAGGQGTQTKKTTRRSLGKSSSIDDCSGLCYCSVERSQKIQEPYLKISEIEIARGYHTDGATLIQK